MKFKKTDELRPIMTESYVPSPIPDAKTMRVNHYRSLLNLDEEFEITEENIDDWAMKRCANKFGISASRMKEELLGREYKGFDPDNFEVDPDEDFDIEVSKS